MALMTKGGRPKTRANADPKHSRSFTVYLYKTYNGRTEIRLFQKKQDAKTNRWKTGKGEIIKSGADAVARIKALVDSWEAAA